MFVLGDTVTNDPGEWGHDYSSDDLEIGKSSESKDVSKPEMSEAEIQNDELLKRINKFYMKDYDWGMITNDKNEVKNLKSINHFLRELTSST